jgi:hypothetical protein
MSEYQIAKDMQELQLQLDVLREAHNQIVAYLRTKGYLPKEETKDEKKT